MIMPIGTHKLLQRMAVRVICAFAVIMTWTGSSLAQPSAAEPSLTQRATDHALLVEQYRESISNIQSQYGPYDERLLPPLENLTRALLEAGNQEEALTALEQQLQIYRVNDGLYTTRQIPIIKSRLDIYAASGEWSRLSDTLGYLAWVYQRDTSMPVDQQLKGLKELGDWHLTALAHDSRDREAFHLLQLDEVDEKAAELAEQHYGSDSEALLPFLYDQALTNTYISLAIMLTSETSQNLMRQIDGIRSSPTLGPTPGLYTPGRLSLSDIETMYGSRVNTVIERSFKKQMAVSLKHLERIKDIQEQNENAEGEGLALMGLGDAILMRQQYEKQPGNYARARRGTSNPGPAMSHYRDALEAFRRAGISEQTLAAYTRCPVLLPISEFHTSIEEAMPNCSQPGEGGIVDLGDYDLQSMLIPNLLNSHDASSTPMTATIQFDIRTNGQINGIDITSIEPDNTANRVQIRRLSELLQFRPAMQEGRALRTEHAQLVVRMPAASSEESSEED